MTYLAEGGGLGFLPSGEGPGESPANTPLDWIAPETMYGYELACYVRADSSGNETGFWSVPRAFIDSSALDGFSTFSTPVSIAHNISVLKGQRPGYNQWYSVTAGWSGWSLNLVDTRGIRCPNTSYAVFLTHSVKPVAEVTETTGLYPAIGVQWPLPSGDPSGQPTLAAPDVSHLG